MNYSRQYSSIHKTNLREYYTTMISILEGSYNNSYIYLYIYTQKKNLVDY